MDALDGGLKSERPFPHGVFWISPPGALLFPRVTDFLSRARAAGVEVHMVEANNFDEIMGDLLVLVENLPPPLAAHLSLWLPESRTRLCRERMAVGRWSG